MALKKEKPHDIAMGLYLLTGDLGGKGDTPTKSKLLIYTHDMVWMSRGFSGGMSVFDLPPMASKSLCLATVLALIRSMDDMPLLYLPSSRQKTHSHLHFP